MVHEAIKLKSNMASTSLGIRQPSVNVPFKPILTSLIGVFIN